MVFVNSCSLLSQHELDTIFFNQTSGDPFTIDMKATSGLTEQTVDVSDIIAQANLAFLTVADKANCGPVTIDLEAADTVVGEILKLDL